MADSQPLDAGTLKDTHDPWLGRTLVDRYVIESKLGSGGMGVVYRACQVSMKRAVAVKVLPASLGEDLELVRRFMREAKLASSLSHPNTVTLHDFGQTPDGALFLVMELVEGETLESHLASVGRLPVARAVAIAAQILDALEEAHGRGIIHRDLKPANVILSPRAGRPDFIKLLDFGLARGGDDGTGDTTRSGAILGTPAYMSPEQGRGQDIDLRSDLYSLGILLFELLTGERPFGGTTNLAILLKHFQEPVPRLSDRCPALGVNGPLEAVLSRALAKRRDDRFATAADMRAALRVAGQPTPDSSPPEIRATPPSASAPQSLGAPPARARSRRVGWAVAAALTAAVTAGTAWFSRWQPGPAATGQGVGGTPAPVVSSESPAEAPAVATASVPGPPPVTSSAATPPGSPTAPPPLAGTISAAPAGDARPRPRAPRGPKPAPTGAAPVADTVDDLR